MIGVSGTTASRISYAGIPSASALALEQIGRTVGANLLPAANSPTSSGGMVLKLNLQLFASKPKITGNELLQNINTRQPGYFYNLQNSRDYGYNPAQEYWRNIQASRNVGSVTAPINYNHVLNLEINGRNRVVGGHATNGNVKIEELIGVSSNGVREARIYMENPANPIERLYKTNTINSISTLVPEWWTDNRTIYEFNRGYQTRTEYTVIKNGREVPMWRSSTPSGIDIEGYLTPNVTVYPKKP